MAIKLENCLPVVKYNGLQTDTAAVLGSTLSVAGVLTATGGVSGAITGATAGVHTGGVNSSMITVPADATTVVTAAQSGATFLATKASATQIFTLPAVAQGLKYTFICGHADGELLINSVASEDIVVTTFAAVGADADTAIVTTTGATGIKNTAATNAVGDNVTLVSDGVKWFGVGITAGIWAAQ